MPLTFAVAVRRRRCAECVATRRRGVDVGAGGRLRPAVRPGCSWRLRSAGADADQSRPRRRSGHMHKIRTESGHMAGTNAGAIRGVLCWAQALSVLRSCVVVELLPALYACRLLSLMVVEWCCGGLPPPGKGPSPAVWGEGLYRLSLRRRLRARLCGVQSSRTSRPRVPAGILASWWSCRGRPCSSA